MIFRAPLNETVRALRNTAYRLAANEDDASYLDLTLAALSQGAEDWLLAEVGKDESAPEPFRRRRAILLRGFIPPDDTHVDRWEEGECLSSWDGLRRRAARMTNRSNHARYWWNSFLAAGDEVTAFSAWHVFLSCVDKTAWVWIDSDIKKHEEATELMRLKLLHYRYNESALKKAMKESLKKPTSSLDGHLVNWEPPTNWFSQETLAKLGY